MTTTDTLTTPVELASLSAAGFRITVRGAASEFAVVTEQTAFPAGLRTLLVPKAGVAILTRR